MPPQIDKLSSVIRYLQFQIPDVTCEQYDANDDGPVEDCSRPHLDVCRNCGWPPPPPGKQGHCWPTAKFPRYFAEEYGNVDGVEDMKKELYKRGPIGMTQCVNISITRFDH